MKKKQTRSRLTTFFLKLKKIYVKKDGWINSIKIQSAGNNVICLPRTGGSIFYDAKLRIMHQRISL